MNAEKIKSIIRHIMTFAGGIVLAFGWLDDESIGVLSSNIEILVGAVVAIIGVVQGVRNKSKLAAANEPTVNPN